MRTILGLVIGMYLWLPAAFGAQPQTLDRITERPPAPALALKDMDGTTHRLEGYRGQVVMVNFWATWCPPCRREMPSMERAWNQLKDHGVVMLAVDVGEDAEAVLAFTADHPVTFPLLLDQEGDVTGAWPVRGLPTTFVVDPEGRLVYQALGSREWDAPELLEAIRALAP